MKLEELNVGDEVQLGIYKGIIVETDDSTITVQFNSWSTINPWTNQNPKITFRYFGMLDKVKNEE